MRSAALFILMFYLSLSLWATVNTVQEGPWNFTFDTQTGYWQGLTWNGEPLLANTHQLPPFNWGPGWPLGTCIQPDLFTYRKKYIPDWKTIQGPAAARLTHYHWHQEQKRLDMTYRIGDWTVLTHLDFCLNEKPDLLAMTLNLEYTPEKASDQPALFSFVALQLPIHRQGRYMRPGSTFDAVTTLESLTASTRLEDHWGYSPISLLEFQPERTAIFMVDALQDLSNLQLTGKQDSLWIQANFSSFGWAYTGAPQTIGPLYLKVVPKNLEDAFKTECWNLYDDLGLTVPPDTPEWLQDAILYCFYPMGNANASRNLGGFKAAERELIPRARKLGFNTLWTMPVEEIGIYCPRDYRKINPKLGTAEEYRQLIKTAHEAGMRFLQDHVPHGGRPEFGPVRGNKPWDLAFDKNGNALNYWCFDYGSPSWRSYVQQVVRDLTASYSLDGFRIDVPDGSHTPNWRRRDFPNRTIVPRNVPAQWWRQSIDENGGQLPPVSFQRASVTTQGSGLKLLHGLRTSLRKVNPQGIVLGEVTTYPYMLECDVIYDKLTTEFIMSTVQRKLNLEELVQTLMRRNFQALHGEPKNTLKMNYTESHDLLTTRGRLGIGMEQAFMATTFLRRGVPMVYQDTDHGLGPFIQELIAARQDLTELRRGTEHLLTATVTPRCIFHVLRQDRNLTALPLVNFSPHRQSVQARIPRHFLPHKPMALDWRAQRRLDLTLQRETAVLNLELLPWSWNIVVFHPAKSSRKQPVPAVSQSTPDTNEQPHITQTENGWDIHAPGYQATVSTEGVLNQLKDRQKRLVVKSIKLKTVSPCSVTLKDSTLTVSDLGQTVRYRFTPHTIELESNGVLILDNLEAEQWEVATAEGKLQDFYRPHPQNGIPGYNQYRKPQPMDPAEIWSSSWTVPDLQNPLVSWKNNQTGVTLRRHDILDSNAGSICLKNRWNGQDGRFTVLQGRHVLTLLPHPMPNTNLGNALTCGKVKLENHSREWIVTHPSYRLAITRNGRIRTLEDARGTQLMANLELQAMGGYRQNAGLASHGNDPDPQPRLYLEGECPVLEFHGVMRYPATWSSIRLPALHYLVRYVFKQTPEISASYSWGTRGKQIPQHQPTFRFAMNIPPLHHSWKQDTLRLGNLNITMHNVASQTKNWQQLFFNLKPSNQTDSWRREHVTFSF